MKIQNSVMYSSFKEKNYNRKTVDNKSEIKLNNKYNSAFIPMYSYIAYLPNFTSKKTRSCTSKNELLLEKSGDFKIAKFSDIPCPACGKKMITQEMFNDISKELETAPNNKYLEILKKYKKYMRPVEESVFDEIYKLSENQSAPKDIRTLLINLRDKKLPILQDIQMRLVKKMIALAKTLPHDEKLTLQKKIKKLKYHIRKTNSEAPFRRKILIARISKLKIRNAMQYEKLKNIAKSFPCSFDMNSAWIVKYSGKNKQNEDWTSIEIAKRFLVSSVANTDHILAYDIEKNHDDISNYIAMHSACNSQKGNKAFLQWLYENKNNRISFLKDYFEAVEKIIKNKISDIKYKDYISLAIETIKKTTKGILNLR